MATVEAQSHLTDPAAVAAAIHALTEPGGAEDIVSAEEALELSRQMAIGGGNSRPLSAKAEEFVPRGEGKSGNSYQTLWDASRAPAAPGPEVEDDWGPTTLTELEVATKDEMEESDLGDNDSCPDPLDVPLAALPGDAQGEAHAADDPAAYVTREELDTLVEGLESYLTDAIDQAVSPLKLALAELTSQLQTMLGTQSSQQMRLSEVSQRVDSLTSTPQVATIKAEASQKARDPPKPMHRQQPSVTQITQPVGPVALVQQFLRDNPDYPTRPMVRRGKMARLASLAGMKAPKRDITAQEWNPDSLLRALSPEP